MKWFWQKRKPQRPAGLEDRFRDLQLQFLLITKHRPATLSNIQRAKAVLEEMVRLEKEFEVEWTPFDGLVTKQTKR